MQKRIHFGGNASRCGHTRCAQSLDLVNEIHGASRCPVPVNPALLVVQAVGKARPLWRKAVVDFRAAQKSGQGRTAREPTVQSRLYLVNSLTPLTNVI